MDFRKAIVPIILGAFAIVSANTVRANETTAPTKIVIQGKAMPAVNFNHDAHAHGTRKLACATCHHPAKMEKAQWAPQQRCTDCHSQAPVAPVKTRLQAAFHDPRAQSGLCIDCHKEENKQGKNAPTKCADCHKKDPAKTH